MEDFLLHSSFIDRCSAEWAELESRLVSVMGDKVCVAVLVELMRLMAGKLRDSLARFHL